MRRKGKVNIAIIGSIIAIGMLTTKVNASHIEIKPNSKGIRSVTVSQSYVTCRNLDSVSSTLGTTALDPHLVTNKDWGAVAYLANSDYGVGVDGHTSSSQGKSGKEITLNSIKYYSTSGNATGVMNWGANPNETTYTQTSSLVSNITSLSSISPDEIKHNVQALVSNIGTRYIESISQENTLGMAMKEVDCWGKWNNLGNSKIYPIAVRAGLFGFCIGGDNPGAGRYSEGGSRIDVTFRPVIWNIN